MIENIGNGIAHFTHGLLQRTGGRGGIGTVRALLIRGFADTTDGSQGPVQDTDHLTERDVFRGFDQRIASPDSSATGQEAGAFQGEQDLFEELDRNILSIGDLMALKLP